MTKQQTHVIKVGQIVRLCLHSIDVMKYRLSLQSSLFITKIIEIFRSQLLAGDVSLNSFGLLSFRMICKELAVP